jgi:sugar O-acyltransferase (sialic acid O-acetyltransferase NeuD family)
MSEQLLIIGAGGLGREFAAALKNSFFSNFTLKGFVDDAIAVGTFVNSVPVLGDLTWLLNQNKRYGLLLAIGNPQIRHEIIKRLQSSSFYYPTIIHPQVSIHDPETVSIGKGCYIADGCILTTAVTIEDFCFLNTSCSLQHDAYIETNSVLMPGVRITGGARIGSGTYIGPNCAVSSACEIPSFSVIKDSILY